MSPEFGIKRGIKRPERAEMAKASVRHPENLDAYSLYWRGVEMHRHFTRSDNPKGREVFAKVIALDPNYARAYAAWAWTHYYDWQNRWIPGNPKESYQKGLDLAYKAVAPDPRDGWVRGTLANFLLYGNKHDEAVAQFEEALKANPNDADLLVFSSLVDLFGGRPKEALQRIKEAMRPNPYHPNWYFSSLGAAQYGAHDYKGGIETLRKMSPIGVHRAMLAACLAQLGRMEEARLETEKFLKDNPSFSVSYWASAQPFLHDKDRQHAVEGFIKAGLPR